MTASLVLTIGQIRIDATGTPEEAERMERTFRQGLELLSQKLSSSELARRPDGLGMAIQQIQLSEMSQEELLGARGAARVADLLYDCILRGGKT